MAMPGYIARARMDYVQRIGYVFQGNGADYKALVARLQDPGVSLPIPAVGSEGAHDLLLSEAERLLHNVLMAVSTRIDQQRAFMDRNFGDTSELTAEYAARIRSTFAAYPSADVLRDLRNYLTHHRLPVAQSWLWRLDSAPRGRLDSAPQRHGYAHLELCRDANTKSWPTKRRSADAVVRSPARG